MADDPQRLSKAVAALVPCSRREAEQFIAEGRVRVDGQVVLQPQARVAPGQSVDIDASEVLQPAEPATFLVHKPAGLDAAAVEGLLAAGARWAGDTSGVRPLRSHRAGLVQLLPLPAAASGLSVVSQDGRIVRKLREDASLLEQELVADVAGSLAEGGLARLCAGLAYEGSRLPPAKVSWQSEHRLRFAVKDIRPEVIAWMCGQVGLQLTALRRLRIGRVPMAGLPPGQWRYLGAGEKF